MTTQQGTLTVHWGKVTLAGIGALSLAATPITAIVAAFTSLSWATPLILLMLAVACVVGLRVAALADRKRRAWNRAASSLSAPAPAASARQDESAPQEEQGAVTGEAGEDSRHAEEPVRGQSSSDAEQQTSSALAPRGNEGRPFDMQAERAAQRDAERAELAAQIVRPAEPEAMSEAAAVEAETESEAEEATQATADAATAQDGDAEAVRAEDEASGARRGAQLRYGDDWQPREVPAPTYLSAPKAERPLPTPFEAEQPLKATSVESIRQAEQARLAAERLDLDAVLQRRRA